MNQRKHLFSPQEAPVFRRRIGPELNDLHIFRIIFIYLLPQMPSRSPKGEAPVRVARRKARPRAPSDAFRPILPPAEARAGNKQLKIGRPGTGRLEIGRLWKGLIGDWRRLSMPGGLLPRRLRCWNLAFINAARAARSGPTPATRPRPKLRAEAATRTVRQIESQLDSIIR